MLIDGKELKVLHTEDEIQSRIREIATEINQRLGVEDELYIICVLKGSVMFMTDLAKHLKMPVKMEFIRLSSYGSAFTSTGKVNAVDISLPDLNDKNVLIIEDIITHKTKPIAKTAIIIPTICPVCSRICFAKINVQIS